MSIWQTAISGFWQIRNRTRNLNLSNKQIMVIKTEKNKRKYTKKLWNIVKNADLW